MHAYALKQLNIFALRGFIFHDNHKKTRKEFQQFGLQNTKIYVAGNIYSRTRTRTFGAELHKSKIKVKRWHDKYKILNYVKRHKFFLNFLLTKSNRTELQTYRVEEQTFGTSCITAL